MAITEKARYQLHERALEVFGAPDAHTLMQLLRDLELSATAQVKAMEQRVMALEAQLCPLCRQQ